MNVENQELFFYSPPSLERLASQELALALCRHAAPHIDVDPDDGLNNFAYSLNFIDPEIEGISSELQELISKCRHNPVALSFEDWCNYHVDYIWWDVEHEYFHSTVLKCMDEFVLKPDGEINFVQTAKNLLKSNKLSNVEKYKFACLYCFVDDIERLWPLVSNNKKLRKVIKSPMVGYWTDVMRGQFQRLSPENSDLLSNKWGERILKQTKYHAVEYFWNFLSEDERLAAAEVILIADRDLDSNPFHYEARGSADQFFHLFLKLSDDRLRTLLDQFSLKETFLNPFISRRSHGSESEWMLAIWKRLKHLINPQEFTFVATNFIKQGFLPFMPGNATFVDSELLTMWTSAPAQFKNHILNDMKSLRDIFKALNPAAAGFDLTWLREGFFEMQFFITLFSEIRFEWRRTLWQDYWPYIIIHAKVDSLLKMMRLCFANDAEIISFKERDMMDVTKIGDFCQAMVAKGRFSELSRYLKFCSNSKRRVANVKRQILQMKATRKVIIKNMNDWSDQRNNIFVYFVTDAFSSDEKACRYIEKLTKFGEKVLGAEIRELEERLGIM